jgi:hypothetical protein
MDITECSLAELMEDPLVGLVMKSDKVDRCELELLLDRVVRERIYAEGRQSTAESTAWPTMIEAAPC